jgi:hypothetical protein
VYQLNPSKASIFRERKIFRKGTSSYLDEIIYSMQLNITTNLGTQKFMLLVLSKSGTGKRFDQQFRIPERE